MPKKNKISLTNIFYLNAILVGLAFSIIKLLGLKIGDYHLILTSISIPRTFDIIIVPSGITVGFLIYKKYLPSCKEQFLGGFITGMLIGFLITPEKPYLVILDIFCISLIIAGVYLYYLNGKESFNSGATALIAGISGSGYFIGGTNILIINLVFLFLAFVIHKISQRTS